MKQKQPGIMSKTYPYYKKYMWGFWVGLFFSLLLSLCTQLLPQVPQLVIDRIIQPALGKPFEGESSSVFAPLLDNFAADDYMGMLGVMVACIVVLCLVRYVSHYSRWNITQLLMMRGENTVRDNSYRKMLRQSPLVLNKYTSGDLLNVTNNDPTSIKDIYLHHIPFLFGTITSMVFAVFFLMRINPLMVLVPACTGVTMAILSKWYKSVLRKRYDEIRRSTARLNTCIQENINGVRVVRSFATEHLEMEKFERNNDDFMSNYVRLAKTTSKYSMLFTFMAELVRILSIILGIWLAVKGKLSVGEFATFTTYCFSINMMIVRVTGILGNFQQSVVSARRYFEFIEQPDAVSDPAEPKPTPSEPHIEFKNVTMSFDGQLALKNVDIDIPYGKRVGIMGKTGAGKSVIMKLLNRLYDVSEGEILMNGVNIKDMAVDEVRRSYGYVMQDVFLFSESVSNNIALYDEDASDERIMTVARHACVDEFAEALPAGYDTIVGERGLGLSGGQKQRVSIARALLKNAPVILLDDCTSALDYRTEQQITQNIFDNYGDRTIIVASHRAGSVANCDEIIYLENGEIVERGTHDELMALGGRYYEVYAEQEALKKEEVLHG